jgi:hypothetical protein
MIEADNTSYFIREIYSTGWIFFFALQMGEPNLCAFTSVSGCQGYTASGFEYNVGFHYSSGYVIC